MKKFIAQLNDGGYINIQADKMQMSDSCIYVYSKENLVAVVDVSVILSAHISEKGAEK